VKFVDQNSNRGHCPDGYEIATSGQFEGLYAGCDCTQSKKSLYSGVRIGYCERNETYAGCRMIERVDPIPFNVYDGKIVCTKRDSELNFYNIKRPVIRRDALNNITLVNCEMNYKLCGSEEANHEY
jgi:hypothetical protein